MNLAPCQKILQEGLSTALLWGRLKKQIPEMPPNLFILPEEKPLKAYLGVFAESLDSHTNRFYVVTSVHDKPWTGPVCFNLIRPFHHRVVSRKTLAGIKGKIKVK